MLVPIEEMNEYGKCLEQKVWPEWSGRVLWGSRNRNKIWKEEAVLERRGRGRENDVENSVEFR